MRPHSRTVLVARATLLGGVLATALAACAPRETTAELDRWSLDAAARLDIGDREDTDSAMFAAITDARLLRGGQLAVADGGAFVVHLFDAAGAKVRTVGRRGRGPGEFLGGMTLLEMPGDSVAVWDPSQIRWTLMSSADGGMRGLEGPAAAATVLHAGLLVRSDLPAPPEWVLRLLTALSAASTEVRVAHLDESALLWVSQDAALREWRVYADSGAPIAALTLPERVKALQFTRDAMVGLATDSVGLQRVVVHALHRGEFRAPDRTSAARPAQDAEASAQLRTAMRNSVTAQELHYMTANAYTAHADSLNVAVPPGARFKVVELTARGWRGVIWFTATGFTCGMFIGDPVPPGWSEGEPRCGW